ncbi:hypothetical protein VOLCADRAFT_121654 [Volvox carteri f. nagariensis]|uniref:Uncharacterized protein n=1 Tax=Volvox carteri f. nagariensis TaxID=3068 RepID=D8UGC6_VOLCA|nr:uncharacterized protein VOLCADRAFT_121654 [Volvox carteri f. nagariensis]EFJ41265.1 hypothetical protein VOLCADRAFT_121654 [Volvox carteri f. nagariensis]|eukprot:XP_002957716.1 hypothetical protein VOLCADRAFT_121654 [Volvox carteri f. nagariensis]
MPLGPFVLPFRGDQYSFAINFNSSPEEKLNFDLACVAFDVKGNVHDTLHVRKPTALDGALVKGFEKQALPEETVPVEGDDVIYMFPKMFERQVEVLVFVASAPEIPGKKHDLSSSSKLEFAVSYTDVSGQAFNQSFDIKSLTLPAGAPEGQVSSIIVAVMYLQAEGGWTLRDVGTCLPYDSPGLVIPEMKRAILDLRDKFGVALDAADNMVLDENERVPITRQWQDQALTDASAGRQDPTAAVPVTKLRLDLSWTFWPPPPPAEEGEDPPEEPVPEFNLIMYNKDGEEVQSISSSSREATGARAGRPEPEEEEEEEEKQETEKEIRSMVLLVTNYDEEQGFSRIRTVRVRVVDVTRGEAPVPGSKAAAAAAAAVAAGEAPAPNPEMLLADFSVLSKYEADKGVTQVALMKLYKEYGDSAYNVFKEAKVDNAGAFVSQDPEAVLTQLKSYLETAKAQKAKEAAALAAAEEEGEEVTTDLRPHTWRFRTLGLTYGGDSLEAVEHDIKNLIAFDGTLAPGEARTCATSRAAFANGDTYFGSYQDDVKHGPGVYTFASGAAYAGEYQGGKRHGRGVMVFPDGGAYVGEFAADKFEGQGQYRYPDGSVYTGAWEAGKKHGPGVYWDTARGCLHGVWKKGLLVGEATYDQPALRFRGEFVRGVPAGGATYTLTGHRTLDMPCFAAADIQSMQGPTLALNCAYGIPPGSGDEPQLDEDGQPIEDPDKPPLPSHPKYEGLTYTAEELPQLVGDTVFPPEEGKPVPLPAVPAFSVATGLVT